MKNAPPLSKGRFSLNATKQVSTSRKFEIFPAVDEAPIHWGYQAFCWLKLFVKALAFVTDCVIMISVYET